MLMKTTLSIKTIYFFVSIILVSISCTKNEDINNQGNMYNKGKLISISDGYLKTVLEYDNDDNVIGGIDRDGGAKVLIYKDPLHIIQCGEKTYDNTILYKDTSNIYDIKTNKYGYIVSAKIKYINISHDGTFFTRKGLLTATYNEDKYLTQLNIEADDIKTYNKFTWENNNIIKQESTEIKIDNVTNFTHTYSWYMNYYYENKNLVNTGIYIPSISSCGDYLLGTEFMFYAGYFGEKTSLIPTSDYFYSEDKGESNTYYNTIYNKYNLISSLIIDFGYNQQEYIFQYE